MNLTICIPRKHIQFLLIATETYKKNHKNYNETCKILQVTSKIFKHMTHNFYNRTNLIQNFEKISWVIPKFIITYTNRQ